MRFSRWVKFDNRMDLPNSRFPGIYALAISGKDIAGQVFQISEKIVYFGMTNSKAGIRGRLEQFNNTMRDKSGGGHGGAERFRYDYEDGEQLAKKLYVSICPFECDVTSSKPKDLQTMGNIARAEYIAFADFAAKYQRLPKYNDKQASPKK